MKNRYTIWRCLTALMLVMVGVCACTDELEGLGISSIRPTDVICFTASLSDNRSASQTRSASGHLEIEQEEWLVGERIVTRGKPVTSLEGSAGVIGYVYDNTWTTSVKPWSGLNNTEYVFNGDELTAKENDVRWNTLKLSKARFYVYAPYSINGGKLSNNEHGGNPTITYTVDATPANQQDLIVASWDGPASYKQSIPLSFEHALTAVKFKVGFECTVTKIEVIGIYNSGIYTFGKGWELVTSTTQNYEISSLTDEANTLMMIPQKLGPDAKVVLYYTKEGKTKTIESPLKDKVWQAGKMITYTIHETKAPETIYFDLAAGNVLICCTENDQNAPSETNRYSGYVYKDGVATEVTGEHNSSNIYHVYQTNENNRATGTLPSYTPITYNGKPWADFIKNNASVAGVIQAWNEAAITASRKATNNRIRVFGSGKVVNLTIDNIYTIYAQRNVSRTLAGIGFNAGSNSKLTITTIGDNRVSAIHYHGGKDKNNQLIFEGTGSLTVCAASGLKTDYNNSIYFGEEEEGDTTFNDNHWCSAIGGNDSGEGNSCGIVINSGNIFAGTTKAENCTAIGAGGNDRGVITINGGNVTAVATTTGTAIGGGIGFNSAGGYGIITIKGGNVYAYNHQNRWSIPSSAIGGAGSSAAAGTQGDVYINGGYVYAYSALGTAIGGGSSKTNVGGDAYVTITGGQIIAKSGSGAGIGGGSAYTVGDEKDTNYNGGTANVKISGNPIIRTGSIGGGNTSAKNGKIGSASVNISGGDIQAQFVMAAGAKETPEFTMSGGIIRNSYVDDEEYIHIKKQGGAVYLEDGTFTMSGGTIKNCSAVQGGAVYVNSQSGTSTFTMEGGEIHSCFATGKYNEDNTALIEKGHGGAVCLMGGQVNLQGGAIWNNYSENGDGGAVYISNGNFAMKNGLPEISANAAHKGNGGGVFVSSENGKSVKVDLLQGIITNNTANNYGGGICVDMGDTENSATVTVGANGQGVTESDANPKISGNMAMMSGGGLYVRGMNANVTINSGMIDQNRVSAYVKNEDVANEMGGVTLNAGLVTHVVVTFDGNGGIVDGTDTYTQNIVTNTNSKLAPNRFKRAGYNFAGWNTRADGLGDSYSEEDAKPHSRDITLYAQWEAQQ